MNTDQDERYLLIVGANDVVQQRPVKLGALFGTLRSITDGLKPGERVIVNGMQSAMPGAKVNPHEMPVPTESLERTGEYCSPAADHADAARDADCRSVEFATFLEGAPVKIAHFFIDRPVFAIVISIVAIIAGCDRDVHAADRPISGDRAADRHRQRYLSRRQRRNRRQDCRHADRRADQRRGEHALHVQPVDQHRKPESDGDVQGRHQPRHGPGAGAEPGGHRPAAAAAGGAAGGDHREEGVAGHHAGGRFLLARRLARHAVPQQLRDAAGQGSDRPAAGRRRHHDLRCARLFDAAVARSRQARGAKHDRGRRRQRGQRAERAGGGGRRRRAAAPQAERGFPVHGERAGPAHRSSRIRRHRRQGRQRRPHHAAEGRGPRRAGRRRLQHHHDYNGHPAVALGGLPATRHQLRSTPPT